MENNTPPAPSRGENDVQPYPGAFVILPWHEKYNPYDYDIQIQAWRRVLEDAEAKVPPA